MQALKAEEVTNVRRAGLAQARRGAVQMFAGALSSVVDPLVEEENKALPLAALAQSAEVYASSFDLAERARVLALSMQARAIAAPRFQEAIDRIIAAMRSERCDGLCRY